MRRVPGVCVGEAMSIPPIVQEALDKALPALEFAAKRIPLLEARIRELEARTMKIQKMHEEELIVQQRVVAEAALRWAIYNEPGFDDEGIAKLVEESDADYIQRGLKAVCGEGE